MVNINTIELQIKTGSEEPDKHTRIFLGFKYAAVPGIRAREFRLRQGSDANPFRSNTTKNLTFGGPGANVEHKSLNDPTNPQLVDDNIIGAYIRVSPGLKQSWKILGGDTFVAFNGLATSLVLYGDITLQEDAGEEVQF